MIEMIVIESIRLKKLIIQNDSKEAKELNTIRSVIHMALIAFR